MSEINEAIHKACMLAFEAGREAERIRFWKAIDLNKTFDDIDEFIYLRDLKDALEELNAKAASMP